VLTYDKQKRTKLTLAIRGRSNGPLCHSVVLPRKPRESFEKPLAASAMPDAEPVFGRRKHSSENKISTTIGHYVRGFQGCQAVSDSINSFFFGNL